MTSDDHPPNTEPCTVTHARDHWWTLNFANAFLSPGVNSRAELVPSGMALRAVGSGNIKSLVEKIFVFAQSNKVYDSVTTLSEPALGSRLAIYQPNTSCWNHVWTLKFGKQRRGVAACMYF